MENIVADRLISLSELVEKHTKLLDGEIILDVRNPDEYADGHIAGSINIPLPDLEARADELKSYSSIYIHCRMGGRAKKAFDLLDSLGFTTTHCLQEAGMKAWTDAGHPVV